MEIFIIIGLILLNGIFAMTELSLVSSRRYKLENARRKGNQGAKIALDLSENPSRFLSTVQIGITLIGILLGVYSGDNLTVYVVDFLKSINLFTAYADKIALAVVVIFITYLSIVLGELFPKRLGMSFPEPIAILLARPMLLLSKIASPFVWLLSVSNELLLKIFGIKKTTESQVSEEEIKSIIKESAKGGEIQDIEQDIVERVFELGDRKINSLFTHRSEIVYFDANDSWEEIREKINGEKHSAYPVCENNDIDEVLGIVLLKDLFVPEIDKDFKLTDYLKKPLYLNENTYAYKVLELFKSEKMHYGMVIDEYGSIQGIVTMDDVVDALVGDATEVDQDEYQIVQRGENSWLVDGKYSIVDFLKYFNITLEDDMDDKFTTVAGLVINLNSALPNVGDKVTIQDYEMEIVDKDGHRIDKIIITRLDEITPIPS